MRGHVTMRSNSAPSDPKAKTAEPTTRAKAYSNLTNEYGDVASSPTVAAAIRKAAAGAGDKNVDRASGAKAAADRAEALAHGHPLPGTNQMELIMHGFVPPGMPAQQAAMLYNSLPNNLKMPHVPQPGTPEWIAVMSREPVDPESGLPFSLKEQQIQAANHRIAEEHMRGRFGPVYVPPLHGDRNVAKAASKMADGIARKSDNQVSLISPQYSYDGGNGPASIREMTDSSGNVVSQYGYDPFGRQTRIGGTGPDADFGYAGYYFHQRSGLNLTVHRAYAPSTMFPNSNLSFC